MAASSDEENYEEEVEDNSDNSNMEEDENTEDAKEDEDEDYQEDIEDYDDGIAFEEEDTASKKESNYVCLKPEEIMNLQLQEINKIAELFQVPPATARQLLTHTKWKSDRLIERYYGGEADKIFQEGGIYDPRTPNSKKKRKEKEKSDKTVECTICLSDYKMKEMVEMPCGHEFCPDCWREYLKIKINDGQVKVIACPAKKCTTQVDEVSINKLIKDKTLLEKYAVLVAQAYVQDNDNVRFCPGKGCTFAIKVELLKDKLVVCNCNTKFCFGCGELPHAPADCKMIKLWTQKIATDGDNASWMASFTKECPKCATLIHKDGGCQYMTCTKCSHRFCWICQGAFDHKSHSCNKFKEETDKTSARAQLNKFMHFFKRYSIHEQSSKLEGKLMEVAEKTMQELADGGMSWIDVQFIKTSTQQLMEAREMLRWTYVYGFCLPENVNRDLFEYLQADLEAGTEKLSGMLESKEKKERLPILNAAGYVKQRIKNLLEGLAEGDITGGSGNAERVYSSSEFEKYNGWIYNAGN